jgi:hypothetical protein
MHPTRLQSLTALSFVSALFLTPRLASGAGIGGHELTVSRSDTALDCPDEAALVRATLALGARPPPMASGRLSITVEFQRDAEVYRARIKTTGPKEGFRELSKLEHACTGLAAATSVVLAILLDMLPAPEPVPETPSPPQRRIALRSPSVREDEPVPAARPGGSALRLALSARAGIAFKLTGTRPAVVMGAQVHPRLGRWELPAGVIWVPARNVAFGGEGVEVSLVGGRVGACFVLWEPGAGGPDLSVCGGGLVGVLNGQGRGFDIDRPASELWLGGEASLASRLRLAGRLALRFGAAAILTRRHTLSVDGLGVAVESGPFVGLLELGPELQFE